MRPRILGCVVVSDSITVVVVVVVVVLLLLNLISLPSLLLGVARAGQRS